MNIFMITRGSQGDVFPYLATASELIRRGHNVALNLPTAFEDHAKKIGVKYYLQTEDDVKELMDDDKADNRKAIKWMGKVMDHQCHWLPDVLKDYDVLVSANTELASPTLAEALHIPLVRTAFAPILPSRIIPPPLLPLPKPNKILRPRLLWYFTRAIALPFLKKPINNNREKFGLKPLKSVSDFKWYTSVYGNNALCYCQQLIDPDPAWDKEFSWQACDYCFYEGREYDEKLLQEVKDFIHKDERPVIFFTLGSCEFKRSSEFFEILLKVVKKLNYRMIVGAGWSKSMNRLESEDDVFVMKGYLPHNTFIDECTAIIHHAGSGTTHMALLCGVPQLPIPLVIDQHFWSYRLMLQGIAPQWINANKFNEVTLEASLRDVVTNPKYKQNAMRLSQQMKKEDGINKLCDYIERIGKK